MIFWYIIAGICGGIIGGMGMGGGTLLIPILTLFLDIEQRQAQAINLVAFIPMAVVVSIINAKQKNLDYKSILKVVLPALPASILTSLAAGKIHSSVLSVIFAVFITCLGVVMFVVTLYKCTIAYMRKCKEEYTLND